MERHGQVDLIEMQQNIWMCRKVGDELQCVASDCQCKCPERWEEGHMGAPLSLHRTLVRASAPNPATFTGVHNIAG